jgi:cytoskeletal protein CcmA (bactofilin family)
MIGKSVVVHGQIIGQEDLVIDGEVKGTVELTGHKLTIGVTGKVQADSIKAREVIVQGSVKGSIHAVDKVILRKDAQLVGDVQTAGIMIEDGAYFKGGIDIRKAGQPD